MFGAAARARGDDPNLFGPDAARLGSDLPDEHPAEQESIAEPAVQRGVGPRAFGGPEPSQRPLAVESVRARPAHPDAGVGERLLIWCRGVTHHAHGSTADPQSSVTVIEPFDVRRSSEKRPSASFGTPMSVDPFDVSVDT